MPDETPDPEEIEPLTRVFWEAGERTRARIPDGDRDLRAYSREVAEFLTDLDVCLTPALSEPPPIGEITSPPTNRPVPSRR